MTKIFRGTVEHDDFNGTTGDDICYGYDGKDTFYGSRGFDVFDGGADIDTVVYHGAHGNVQVDLLAGWGEDGEGNKDTYVSIENVSGSIYSDTLAGDNNPNVLDGDSGRDSLYGRGGDDTLRADMADYVVDGGSGTDTLVMSYASGLAVTLNNDGTGTAVSGSATVQLANIENVSIADNAASGLDSVFGNPGAILRGNSLNNELRGSNANDTLNGGDGNDTLFGGAGSDTFIFTHSGSSHHHQHDTILDFRPNTDHIDLSNTPVNNFADLLSDGDRYMEDYDNNGDGVNDSVMIHTSENNDTSILVLGVHTSNLQESDFIF